VTSPPPAVPHRAAAALVAVAVLEAVLIALWQRNGYWEVSDGVYAASARAWLHGFVPYRDVAAAQPPPVYLTGLGLLALHDGLASLRAGLAALNLITALLCGLCVWRLTARRDAAAVTVLAMPLLVISLHEHAQLVPETLAAPLLMAGALLCSRRPRAGAGGGVLALAAFCKFAFLLPAVAIVIAARGRLRAAVALGLGLLALAIATQLAFGAAAWRETVQAQLQVGSSGLHNAAGLIAQVVWNEFPLVAGAIAAICLWLRSDGTTPARTPHSAALLRTLGAGAVAGLLLTLTVFKRGSSIDVLVVAEPPLLVLAVCGAVWGLQRARGWRIATSVLAAVLLVQSASLLLDPGDPWAAVRPGARSGMSWTAGPGTVARELAVARRCPAGLAYGGSSYLAFLAGRRMPGQQPDLFIIATARADAPFAARAAGDQPRCPAG
jgi:hypothetical protein